MKGLKKRILALITCVAMVVSMLPQSGVAYAADSEEYLIYPTPHEMTYQDGDYVLKENVNVIYDEGIDDVTKGRLEEAMALKGLTVSESEASVSDATNVYVGINGSNGPAETYIEANYTVDASLFDETDSYFLASDDNTIVVLGKDTDASFYGLTTLYHVLAQMESLTIRNFTVKDYADVVSRGFIEGYYGNPWSTEDRCNLMEWGGYYKLNSYFYAPKDDPKHNSNWRELYTTEEIEEKIKPLAEAGNNSKCRFVYALHPYMYNAISYASDEAYQADLKVMQDKFTQVIEAGVRQIAILADDAANVGSDNYIKTLEDMTAWLEEMRQTYPDLKMTLPFCTQEYMYNGESYYSQFPENVQIVMTGGKVWGEVSNSFTTTFTNTVGRGPYLWINWPCTDNSKNHLIMGGYTTFLQSGVDPSNIQGIVLNPMQQSEPSKVAIFGNACYSWNIWETDEEADAAWDASFSFVDHNTAIPNAASNALRELSKHMINQNMDTRVTALQESVDLKDTLNDFKAKLDANTVTDEDIDAVIAEFVILQNAAKTYREEAGDTNIRDQIVYWLNCWDDTTEAIISYLNAVKALNNGEDDATAWEYYSNGQAHYEASKTYGFHYVDHTEYAEVGVQHIVPFMAKLDQVLSAKVATIVDPTKEVATYITNRTDAPATGSVSNITDGDDTTSAVYQTPNQIVAGDYVGMMYSKVKDINNIHFVLGAGKDHFDQGKLQYTMDGTTWEDIELVGMTNLFNGTLNVVQDVSVAEENLPADFEAMGIRFIATVDNEADAWLEVREISINKVNDNSFTYSVIKSSTWSVYENYSDANLYDGSDDTFAWYNPGNNHTAIVDDYIGYDFGNTITLDTVHLVVGNDGEDKFRNYTVETSVDGSNWTAIPGYESYTGNATGKDVLDINVDNLSARYIRVRNLATQASWVQFSEFTVTVPNAESDENVFTNTDLELESVYEEALTSLVPASDLILEPNEYVGVDLGRIKDLATIEVADQGSLTLQVSKNAIDWTEVEAGAVTEDARYIRLINNTEEAVTVDLTEFEVASNEVAAPSLYETTMGINSSWGVAEDTRNNGAAFDGSVDTPTEFGDLPQQGQYIIYDLGQEREISKLEMYCQDSAVNYIRDAIIAVSNDLENWTDVITIGDGVENTDDANVTCINSGAGYSQTTSDYPNKVSVEGTIEATTARYIRILMTATNNNRAVVFNEIAINDGEYVPVMNDPTFDTSVIEVQGFVPQNMFDGDLTTAYRPDTTEAGYMQYTLSDNLAVNHINIVQKGEASGAKVTAYVEKDGERSWVELGALNKSLNQFSVDCDLILELKVEWEAEKIPTITEIIRFSAEIADVEPVNPFVDVQESDYYYNAVLWAVDAGITSGTSATTFEPGNACTRGQVVAFLWRAAGKPEPTATTSNFTDVVSGAYYEKAVLWAVEQGITSGTSTTTFEPDATCTRAQIAAFLWRAADKPEPTATTSNFTDVISGSYYEKAVLWAVGEGITSGTSTTTFGPNEVCTRGQIVTFLYRNANSNIYNAYGGC